MQRGVALKVSIQNHAYESNFRLIRTTMMVLIYSIYSIPFSRNQACTSRNNAKKTAIFFVSESPDLPTELQKKDLHCRTALQKDMSYRCHYGVKENRLPPSRNMGPKGIRALLRGGHIWRGTFCGCDNNKSLVYLGSISINWGP